MSVACGKTDADTKIYIIITICLQNGKSNQLCNVCEVDIESQVKERAGLSCSFK
uniref:Uncharacterized protein n=1 Tax=Arion vulgaris TaxID=1028688 RepID=A0A0B7B470_9EUPU